MIVIAFQRGAGNAGRLNDHAIRCFGNANAHFFQIGNDCLNTVRLFKAKPLRAAYTAALQPAPALSYPSLDYGWSMLNGQGDEALEKLMDANSLPVLKPQFSYTVEGFDWLTVQAVGLVDNALHLQLRQDEDLGRFSHVNLGLQRTDDEESGMAVLEAILEEGDAGFSSGVQEYVLPLPEGADPAEWTLYASGVSCTVHPSMHSSLSS